MHRCWLPSQCRDSCTLSRFLVSIQSKTPRGGKKNILWMVNRGNAPANPYRARLFALDALATTLPWYVSTMYCIVLMKMQMFPQELFCLLVAIRLRKGAGCQRHTKQQWQQPDWPMIYRPLPSMRTRKVRSVVQCSLSWLGRGDILGESRRRAGRRPLGGRMQLRRRRL